MRASLTRVSGPQGACCSAPRALGARPLLLCGSTRRHRVLNCRAEQTEPGAPSQAPPSNKKSRIRKPASSQSAQQLRVPPSLQPGGGTSQAAADAAAAATLAQAMAAAARDRQSQPPPTAQPTAAAAPAAAAQVPRSFRHEGAPDADAEELPEPQYPEPPHPDFLPRPPTSYSGGPFVNFTPPPPPPAPEAPPRKRLDLESLRTQPHEFASMEDITAGGAIVVALDDTDDAAAAVEYVARYLYVPGVDEIRVVHVVADPRGMQSLTSLGPRGGPGGSPFALDSLDTGMGPTPGYPGAGSGQGDLAMQDYIGRLNAKAEAVVKRRCAKLDEMGVPYEFELPRLRTPRSAAGIAEALLETARDRGAKLLVVASHGPGALAEYGSVSRFCYQHSPLPLLLVPSEDAQCAATAGAVHRLGRNPWAPLPPPMPQPAGMGAAAVPVPNEIQIQKARASEREVTSDAAAVAMQDESAVYDWGAPTMPLPERFREAPAPAAPATNGQPPTAMDLISGLEEMSGAGLEGSVEEVPEDLPGAQAQAMARLGMQPLEEEDPGPDRSGMEPVAEPQEKAPPAPESEVLLVVNHLEELANVWQWVAENVVHKGDTLSICHVAGPSASGLASLPTAIANQLRRRGLADCRYRHLYSGTGDPQDLGDQVCALAAGSPSVRMVVLLNYSRRGLLQEALHGSVASHLSRNCCRPLLLLQLPE
ncbi:hypothetical protein HYH03_014018 [Edaphochlamys debaryana]|uniref:UspA domain-containing protein n=1 Tax=Edaphochlamys debaryana TaxID=47281 RepID=A0A836BSG0_9CHLO|nr:hypothetical protein HYH03_014018 [Edaphochlamys debaryana]|eukprot:KAG2487451.1 hypothetical protein HYH03_014018 [Edaphochlamys debaryana]